MRLATYAASIFFASNAALEAFTQSELAKTIPTAYEAVEVRREVYDLMYPLRPERGPFTDKQGS